MKSGKIGVLVALLWWSLAAAAAPWADPAPAPAVEKPAAVQSLRIAPQLKSALRIDLGEPEHRAIEVLRARNTERVDKLYEIGLGRRVPAVAAARSESLRWEDVAGGIAAQWEIVSAGAVALRIGLDGYALPRGAQILFLGMGASDTVYGPYDASQGRDAEGILWSPVLEGDRAVVEIYLPDDAVEAELSLGLAWVSHLFASPARGDVEVAAKAAGACEVDLICRSATDAALAQSGRAVARMTFTSPQGGTALCTGTLLNTTAGPVAPYFYSASHCISTQATANTLATHWFYDRTGCNTGVLSSSYVQVGGGATLLYNNATTDVLLLRLNSAPPSNAIYAGWDAATVSNGVALTAVHHPAGDVKKVSLGTMGGFSAYGGSTGSTHLIALWNSTATGVTEGGSSGSGIFTAVGQPATSYRLRGGLHGGPSSCSATGSNLRDYYSRLDQAFPSLASYLDPSPSCSFSISPTSASIGPGSYSGSFGVTASAGCTWSATSNAGWISTASSGNGSGTVSYSASANAGAARSGSITVGGQSFTLNQQASAQADPARLVNISTRGPVLTGDNVMIGGFIIGGASSKTVVVRARGPSLAQFGVPGVLTDPVLQLYSGQTVIASNDDWPSAANYQAIQASGFAPSEHFESAILATLAPGPYTAIVTGFSGGTGIAIVEVFEVGQVEVPLINISTRGPVQTGDNVMIGGFIIQGNGPQTVVIRARGPSLAQFGVPGVLADPVLDIYSGQTLIASNDDWPSASNASAIQASAFAPTQGLESAILVTLNPGAYTAIVRGFAGGTGVGIVEVFKY